MKTLILYSLLFFSSVVFAAADGKITTTNIYLKEPSPGLNKIRIMPPSFSTDYTLTLPTSAGSASQVLSTDGSGVLSWVAQNAGTGTVVGTGTTGYLPKWASSTGLTDSAAIDFGGRLGIGVATPTAIIEGREGTYTTNQSVGLNVGTVAAANGWLGDFRVKSDASGNARLSIGAPGDEAFGVTERISILKSGRIGLGTTTPQGKLDLQGDLRIAEIANPGLSSSASDSRFYVDSTSHKFLGSVNGGAYQQILPLIISGLGTSDQIVGMNNAGTATEYKSLVANGGISLVSSAGSITLSLATPVAAVSGGTGLSAYGSSGKILGMNQAGTALEYKSLVAGTNVTITSSAGSVTITAATGGAATGLAAKLVMAGTTNCNWSTTSTTYADLSADTDCTAGTATTGALLTANSGSAAVPGTKIPQLDVTNLPAGTYEVSIFVPLMSGDAATYPCYARVSDGTNVSSGRVVKALTNGIGTMAQGVFSYASTQASISFKLQGARGTGTCYYENSTVLSDFVITVVRVGDAS